MKRPRIFVTQPIAKSAIDRLRALGSVKIYPDDSRIMPKAEADRGGEEMRHPVLPAARHGSTATWSPPIRSFATSRRNRSRRPTSTSPKRPRASIPVTVVPPVTTEATADLTFGLMLAVARRMVEGDRMVRAGKFPGGQSRHLLGAFVWGKTIGLVGGGGLIGKAVARRAQGFGMRVLYWTPRRKPESEEREAGLTYVPLDELLRESDFVSLHSPLNADDPPSDRRARARPDEEDARSSSTPRAARSSTRAAMVRALKGKKIAGAGLDVFEHEPKVHAELKRMKNVVLVPHLGSATVEVREEMANIVVDNIVALLEGRRPPNIVNPEVLAS